jgi:hypothetical protein
VKFPKLAVLMDNSESDVLAFMSFPKAHRAQIHSTNPLERVNAEIKRRTDVVGIFPGVILGLLRINVLYRRIVVFARPRTAPMRVCLCAT